MAISFNTGTTTFVTNSASATGTVTIPAGVLAGDAVFVLVMAFTTATGTLTDTLTSTGTAPSLVGSQVNSGTLASIQVQSGVWLIKATATDGGKTLTFGTTGGTGGAYWYNVGLAAYTGANSTPVDVSNQTSFNNSSTGTTTTPAATTVASGDWQIQLLGVAPPNGTSWTGIPGGLMGREAILTAANAGLLLNIADSNASVGAGGTSIGNTTWTSNGSGGTNNTWSTSFTVGLAPAITPAQVNRMLPNQPYLQVFRAGPAGAGSSR